MSDVIQSDHEYIPSEVHSTTWPGDWKEHAARLECELNNMTEALRQVNARLGEVTKERDALRARLAAVDDDRR